VNAVFTPIGLVDHGWRTLTGSWPGEDRPAPE
jgi:hypothetical protein